MGGAVGQYPSGGTFKNVNPHSGIARQIREAGRHPNEFKVYFEPLPSGRHETSLVPKQGVIIKPDSPIAKLIETWHSRERHF